MPEILNLYGDKLVKAGAGHGADISTQRADALDQEAVDYVQKNKNANIACLELGAGRGAQSARLLGAGAALVLATDMVDFSTEFNELALAASPENYGQAFFLCLNLLEEKCQDKIAQYLKTFQVITFQRTIHYLQHNEARKVLTMIASFMDVGSKLFLSASGMSSELSKDYVGLQSPIENRFGKLSDEMAIKHGILAPVCLYHKHELATLCQESGLQIILVQESEFRNVKIIATKKI